MTGRKETFVMNVKYLKYARKLTDEEFGQLMRIVFNYQDTGVEPEEGSLSPVFETLFDIIKADIDENNERYAAKIERLSEAGKKSAEAKKAKKEQKEQMSTNSTNVKSVEEVEQKEQMSTNSTDMICNEVLCNDMSCNEDVVVDDMDAGKLSAASPVVKAYESMIGYITPRVVEVFDSFSLSDELKIKAIQEAHDCNKKSLKYVEAIMARYEKENIKTIADAERKPRKTADKGKPPNYDFDEIEMTAMRKRLGGNDDA